MPSAPGTITPASLFKAAPGTRLGNDNGKPPVMFLSLDAKTFYMTEFRHSEYFQASNQPPVQKDTFRDDPLNVNMVPPPQLVFLSAEDLSNQVSFTNHCGHHAKATTHCHDGFLPQCISQRLPPGQPHLPKLDHILMHTLSTVVYTDNTQNSSTTMASMTSS